MRPGFQPLPRPYDTPRKGSLPKPPLSIPGLVAVPALARVAHRLGLTMRQIDEQLTVEDVLDELDLHGYLFDMDNPPLDKPPGHK